MINHRLPRTPKSTLVMAGLAVAVLTAPMMAPASMPVFGVEQAQAQGKSNGNGNGKGNSARKNDDRGNSNANRGNSGNNGKGNGNGQARGNAANLASASVSNGPGEKNLNARLGRLNSLKRNVNGLMNSQDPHMAGVRAYVEAGADLETAVDDLQTAQQDFRTAHNAYVDLADSLGVSGYEDISPAGLEAELDAVDDALAADEENAGLLAEQNTLTAALEFINSSQELRDLIDAFDSEQAAQTEVTRLEGLTSDDALMTALSDATNGGRTVDAEMLEWARAELEGTTADYAAQTE